ncbi:ribonuclease H-like domain-containing protein [Tanacetum coccineum]
MSGTHDEIPPPPPPPQETQQKPTQQTPQTVSTYNINHEHSKSKNQHQQSITHHQSTQKSRQTSNPIWEVIQNGNGPVSVTLDTTGQIKILPPKTAEEMVLRERERKARTTLLMAIPEDHLAKFHKMTDAKDMWFAIKSRFGGNDESKKMQKYILKQQFEGFTVSNSDGIHKGYERFQSLLSQLEIHGAGVSTEDANQKFLRSLPSAWLQVSLIMRNKPGMDSLSFDDLYNNLRVFENDVKGSTASSSNLQNIAFVSENTNSTNEVSTAYGVSHSSGHCLKAGTTINIDHIPCLQSISLAMISMRINKFQKKTGRKLQFDAKEPVGFDKTKVECFKCHKTGHFARECRTKEENRRRDGWNTGNREGRRTSNRDESITGKKEESRALVTVDGECVDWTTHSEDNDNYAFMANNSTGSDTQYESIVIMNDEIVSNNKDLDTPSFATKHVKTPAVLGNKTYLADYQDINGGPVAFGGSRGYITGKDSFLPNTFWAEAVSTACYVLNRVLVTKPHNKTPYELLTGKSDEGIFVGKGPNWLFDLDYLTDSMNYLSVSSENQTNIHAGQQATNQNEGSKDKIDSGNSQIEDESAQDCLKDLNSFVIFHKQLFSSKIKRKEKNPREYEQVFFWMNHARLQRQEKEATKASGTNFLNTVSIPVGTASANEGLSLSNTKYSQEDDYEIPPLEDIHEDATDGIFTHSSYDDEGAVLTSQIWKLLLNQMDCEECLSSMAKLMKKYMAQPPVSKIQSLLRKYTSVKSSVWANIKLQELGQPQKTSHLQAVKRILGKIHNRRLSIFLQKTNMQCKKQTIVATSTTEAEYVAAASCCGQVLWIQNQMLDYGFNFMNTKIYIDNESTICIVKNPVYHSKTKHIAIRHHFIRDAYEKKLIQVLKIHTNDNVADLLTKAFDVSRFQFLVVSIGMVPFEQQPDHSPSPSPRPSPNPSPTPNIPDSIPEHTGENLGDHSFNDTSLSGMRMQ